MPLLFFRVQVLEVSQKADTWALDTVFVKFIDEGRTGPIPRDQLLHLPENFQALPPQAMEFIVCRVKPADNEIEWNPKVSIISAFYSSLTFRVYLTQNQGLFEFTVLRLGKCFLFLSRESTVTVCLGPCRRGLH